MICKIMNQCEVRFASSNIHNPWFFLSVGDNLKIFLQPCTQEEKFEVKYCFNYMWHHNFSKFVPETRSRPPPAFATLLLGPINI